MVDYVRVAEYHVLTGGIAERTFATTIKNTAFDLTINDGRAVFHVRANWSEGQTRRHLREYLHSWEADMLLQPPAGPRRTFTLHTLRTRSGAAVTTLLSMEFAVGGPDAEANHRRQFPWLYHKYESIPLVKGLIDRYHAARLGNELLAVTGYFCLSALEQAVPVATAGKGRRERFCNYFGIDSAVRMKFGDLTSSVGTFNSARKIDSGHDPRNLTSAERYWIEAALRIFIERAGHVMSGNAITDEVTLGHLPPVP